MGDFSIPSLRVGHEFGGVVISGVYNFPESTLNVGGARGTSVEGRS
jgi:hypothetical protein